MEIIKYQNLDPIVDKHIFNRYTKTEEKYYIDS